VTRAVIALGVVLAVVAARPTPARADDLASCNAALIRGQELAQKGRLLAARAAFPACLRAECDEALRAVCANFVGELRTRIPSLRVEAHGPNGAVTGLRLYVDGELVAFPLQAIELDPGDHVVRVEATSFVPKEEHVVLTEADRPRSLVLSLTSLVAEPAPAPLPVAPSVAPPPKIPWTVYALGGTSAIGLGSFAFFALEGRNTESSLRATCPSGPCDSSGMRREYLAADISLGLALVAAGAALWIALTRASAPSPRSN
jgi:hypothetical protein